MPIWLLLILVFLCVFGLATGLFYFLVQAPGDRRRMRGRLETIQQVSFQGQSSTGLQLVRDEVMGDLPLLERLVLQLPVVNELSLFLQQAGLTMRPSTLVLISVISAIAVYLLSLLFSLPILFGLGAAAAAGATPMLIVSIIKKRRFAKFEEMFPDAMDMLARAVRTGYAVSSAFELIAEEMSEPLAEEFQILYDQQNLGLPLREALENMALRLPLPDVRIFVTTMQIQIQSGGNLAEILNNLSTVVRERFKIYRQIKIYTAEGRLSLVVLTALPPIAALLFFLLNRNYMNRLFTDPLGHMFIAGAIILQILGFLVIRKIINIQV